MSRQLGATLKHRAVSYCVDRDCRVFFFPSLHTGRSFLDELLLVDRSRSCHGNHGQGRHGKADRFLPCFPVRGETAVFRDSVARP